MAAARFYIGRVALTPSMSIANVGFDTNVFASADDPALPQVRERAIAQHTRLSPLSGTAEPIRAFASASSWTTHRPPAGRVRIGGRQRMHYRSAGDVIGEAGSREDWATTYGVGFGYGFARSGRVRINLDESTRNSVLAPQNYKSRLISASLDYAF